MPMYAFKCENCGEVEMFRRMKDDQPTKCDDCGGKVQRIYTVPAMRVKAAPESPQKSVERILGEKREHFDCPWPDAATGKSERIYRKGGEDRAAWKRRIQDTVLNTKIAQKRKLTRNDVNPLL